MHRRQLTAAAVLTIAAAGLGPVTASAGSDRVCRVNPNTGSVVCLVKKAGSAGGVATRGQRQAVPSVAGVVPVQVPVIPPQNRFATVPGGAGGGAAGVVVTPAQLGVQAAASLRLPEPEGHRSPEELLPDGRPTTYVRLQTWFYVPAAQWEPVRVTASAGGLSATATATPTVLMFDPGDGSGPVSCAGPGRAWVYGQDKNFDPAPGGCSYAYLKSSYGFPGGMVTATYSITWEITWAATGGAGGGLPDVMTTSTARFAVAEAQAVVQ